MCSPNGPNNRWVPLTGEPGFLQHDPTSFVSATISLELQLASSITRPLVMDEYQFPISAPTYVHPSTCATSQHLW